MKNKLLKKSMKKFWIIEDDKDLQDLLTIFVFETIPKGYSIKTSSTCIDVLLESGDIVLLDQIGTKPSCLRNKDIAKIISMSGDLTKKADIYKPFSFRDLRIKILNSLEKGE